MQLAIKHGWTIGVVERYVHQIRKKFDLFGGIDLVAIQQDDTLGIQATSVGNAQARVQKLLVEPRMILWLLGEHRRLQVWGWGKYKVKKGGKAVRWKPRIVEISLEEEKLVVFEYPEFTDALSIAK
jgi:hypothetical protein